MFPSKLLLANSLKDTVEVHAGHECVYTHIYSCVHTHVLLLARAVWYRYCTPVPVNTKTGVIYFILVTRIHTFCDIITPHPPHEIAVKAE